MTRRFRLSFALVASAGVLFASPRLQSQQPTAPATLAIRSLVAVFPIDNTNARVRVAIFVTEPKLPLADSSGSVTEELIGEISAVDLTTGQTAATTTKGAKLFGAWPAPSTVPANEQTVTVGLDAALTLAAGRYELRADVRSRTGPRSGKIASTFDVPEFFAQPLQVSDLVLGSSGNPRGLQGIRHVAVSGPRAPVWPFYPAIDHTFASTDDVRVYAEVARASPSIEINASAEILDRAGRIVVQRTPIVAAGAPGSIDTTLTLQWLGPGSYRVRVTAKDGTHTATREAEFVVK